MMLQNIHKYYNVVTQLYDHAKITDFALQRSPTTILGSD